MATYYHPTSYLSTQQQQIDYQEPDASFLDLFSNNMHPRIENGHNVNEEHNLQYQELSLSLGVQKDSSFQYNYLNPRLQESRDHGSESNKIKNSDHSVINVSDLYQIPSGVVARIYDSRFLKPSQELLDEVANLHEAMRQFKMNRRNNVNKFDENYLKMESRFDHVDLLECVTSSPGELSVSEKQDLQKKITNLFSLIDEVDRKYREYCQNLRTVESTLDTMTGSGTARSYTTLAHQTISRHFRSLRDAINEQIQVTRQKLGEQDDSSDRVLPRLRNVEKQLRQQRTGLNPLGVMRHSWRPQRGLPENSVSILRAWLFEHFLNPYPKDSEKIMLAKQTGLTRSQIANWFINARVRLWKPMVEDMYKEEFRDQEVNENLSSLEEKAKDLQKNTTFMASNIVQSGDSNHEFANDLADQYRFDESDFVAP